MARSPFRINFRNLPLSKHARNQLGAIAESLPRHPDQRSVLVNDYILPYHYDSDRGLYLPLSSTPKLVGYITENFSRVPHKITPADGSPLTFFGNALMLPRGWGNDGFDRRDADKPILRATNAGFLVVTHEYDCGTRDAFEQQLAWLRKGGDFTKVDAELRRYRDYLGYCIVLSGRRSLHFHFLFDTTHLERAAFDADWEARLTNQAMTAAIMHNVHDVYWMTVGEVMSRILNPSVPTDAQLKSIVQWRRLPWGTRTLDKDAQILGLSAGNAVPQLVIGEHIRQRAAKGSTAWLVAPDFSTAHPMKPTQRRGSTGLAFASSGVDLIAELQSICQPVWGEYPKPVLVEQRNGEATIRFQNHASDKDPSTFVAGNHRKLSLHGVNSFTQDFYLPDELTAQELVNHLGNRFANPQSTLALSPASDVRSSLRQPPYKRHTGPSRPLIRQLEEGIRRGFPESITDASTGELQSRYRDKLREVVSTARDFKDYIVLSGEGIGKTTAHFNILGDEALDAAMSSRDDVQRFSCFAFRSSAQAVQKAEEYLSRPNSNHRHAVQIQSFWQIYKDCCSAVETRPIPKIEFSDHSINAVLRRIRDDQSLVFARLEAKRKAIWPRFDAGSTMIFTSHGTAMSWHVSRITRIWHHPDFQPFDDSQDHDRLRRQFVLATVIIDEPELDEMLHFMSKPFYDHLRVQQLGLSGWRNLDRHSREVHFASAKDQIPEADRDIEFETYDELMRLNLDTLAEIKVDYDAIPFGHDHTPTGIYRAEHGKTFYIGEKDWPFASQTRWGFLTTERLVTDIIAKIYDRRHEYLLRVDADNLTGVYPLRVPLYCDTRASSRHVTELAKEIVDSNSQAWVISDGVGNEVGNVLTFQRMKGSNDLADDDIYVIVTPLAPGQYARLNVIGQWLGIPDIIALYYQGIINQAVGRNTGFRQREGTKTVVVTSLRMRKVVPEALNQLSSRVLLYQVGEKPW